MGGLGSGRLPDELRRREAVRLREQGLSLSEIGLSLGVSRQRVGQMFRAIERQRKRCLRCRACGGAAGPVGLAPSDADNVLCLACLARCPEAPFAERLRSCRAAAGLTRRALARRTGLTTTALKCYEDGTRSPRWRRLLPLVRALGVALVAPGTAAGEGDLAGLAAPPVPEPCPA